MSRIRLVIDRVVLKGMSAADGKVVVDSFREELRDALANDPHRAEWAASHKIPLLRLARTTLGNGRQGATKLGGDVARGIRKGLRP